jgi:serine/threonine protein kinase
MDERILQPGERVGTYEVISHLAMGGLSAIYSAKDLDPESEEPEQLVALKVCRHDPATISREQHNLYNARLAREFHLLEPLWHRNVVRVFESQYHEGLAFYAMELLDGPTLGKWMADERRSFLELMLVYRQLVGALAYAHRAGVVHRDLKPTNIILVPPGRVPQGEVDWGHEVDPDEEEVPFLRKVAVQPVLIDFGIAQSLGAAPITGPGTLVGTAEFVSPEYAAAVLGRKLAPTYRAEPHEDVFQLGVLLYAMLTGRLPTRTSATQLLELLAEIRDVAPPHPRKVNPDAPPTLSDLALECLAKSGGHRPQDAAELARQFTAALREDAALLQQQAPVYLAGAGTDLTENVEITANGYAPNPRPARARTTASGQRMLVAGVSAFLVVFLGLVGVLALQAFSLVKLADRLGDAQAQEARPAGDGLATGIQPTGVSAVLGGLPMPKEMRSEWLRCPDCSYGSHPDCTIKGKKVKLVVGYRGVCWYILTNTAWILEGRTTCSGQWYDPPADAPEELKSLCFRPLQEDKLPPQSVDPSPAK